MKKLLLLSLILIGCSKANSGSTTTPTAVVEKQCKQLEVILHDSVVGYIKKVRVGKRTICYVFFDEDGGSTMDCVRRKK